MGDMPRRASHLPVDPVRYDPLPERLQVKLRAIDPSRDPSGLDYFPCSAVLRSGDIVPRVYIVAAQAYLRAWGIPPALDAQKQELAVSDLADLSESAERLPVVVANQIYAAGESAMGGSVFTLEFRDGSRQAYATGNAVDFVELPPDQTTADIIRVYPHEGRDSNPRQGSKYAWCLFEPSAAPA